MNQQKRKQYAFKTNDRSTKEFLDKKANVDQYLKSIVEKDMKGLLKTDTQRLKDLKLTLECWLKLKELGVMPPKINNAFEVISGEEKIPIPPMTVLQNGTIEENKSEIPPEWEHYCKSIARKIVFSRKLKPECHLCGEKEQDHF